MWNERDPSATQLYVHSYCFLVCMLLRVQIAAAFNRTVSRTEIVGSAHGLKRFTTVNWSKPRSTFCDIKPYGSVCDMCVTHWIRALVHPLIALKFSFYVFHDMFRVCRISQQSIYIY